MAKIHFEEWLQDLASTEIKHIHNDNGVFVADVFHAHCTEKLQSRSCSGVGAHHQNAHAEHAIQTIMYMTQIFMLHDSLHLSRYGVDDLALWPFAVMHAIWLYNQILSKTTGLTCSPRLELIIKFF